MPVTKVSVGARFAKLLVLERAGTKAKGTAWLCACECGTFARVKGSYLTSGHTSSCGCKMRDAASSGRATHGHTRSGKGTATHSTWRGIIQRCRNSACKSFARYGGKGIDVCDDWMRFENFLRDMGEKPAGTSIDRIDNSKGYEPGNCRWARASTQARNRSKNVYLEYMGERMVAADWAARIGVSRATITQRIKRGLPIEEVLAPLRKSAERIMGA